MNYLTIIIGLALFIGGFAGLANMTEAWHGIISAPPIVAGALLILKGLIDES